MFAFSFIFDFVLKMYYGKTEDKKVAATGKGQDFSYESVAR